MGKKLYQVTVEFEAYVWAEDEFEADGYAGEISGNETPHITVTEAGGRNLLGWTDGCAVYHDDEGDVYLRDVKTW
jgi:hypothetical protein